MNRPFQFLTLAGAALGVLTGCRDARITTYQVPKEDHFDGITQVAEEPDRHAAGESIQFKTPEGWVEQDPGTVRRASFRIEGDGGQTAEVAVTVFPGGVGGLLANVNRWRDQLRLPPIQTADLEEMVHTVSAAAGEFQWVDLVSEVPLLEGGHRVRMFAALLPRGGSTWFVRLTGSDGIVAGEREPFIEFLRNLQFVSPESETGGPASEEREYGS